ncbi:hypothetical protein [Sinorhizobium fredii]|uniref:Uncharacterized protein n=1 Tax=Rhizobium fredii TaxID=380 RepID=A0A2L0HC17_RHIFR|nr:hypothetical protein [Sinorhizobium fredii]AUX78319.1 hypothetical protein NXT3_PA00023 [Sinorhizobium fredii]
MRHELDAREYKLLLNPDRFKEVSPEMVADTFWDKHLKRLIDAQLGSRNGDEPRHERRFFERKERVVRFWDTPDCTLTRADLALRERLSSDQERNADARPEITLKLRMADLFVVAAAELPGNSNDFSTTFEEDIAPLEVNDPEPGKRSVVVPSRRSIRSRFARSTTQTADWNTHRTLGGLRVLFSTVFELLEASGVKHSPLTELVSGPTVRELVFKGARVKLGAGIVGKFSLTLWYFGSQQPGPTVAEISFKCATVDGNMPGAAARRALALFVAMQTDLGGWVNSEHSSKTALALPAACGKLDG